MKTVYRKRRGHKNYRKYEYDYMEIDVIAHKEKEPLIYNYLNEFDGNKSEEIRRLIKKGLEIEAREKLGNVG
jgi:hypothetical protein